MWLNVWMEMHGMNNRVVNAINILRRKTARGRRVRLDDTDMVLSVSSQRNIDKHFEGTSVDWEAVEK
ncbi:hypothetical protein N7463_005199 [Penicillium fimorum]|uniref:Uncharacterized protein n=1 Tax=Penicillium fimorum TaxID=1882269 RepID=A0A9X0C5E8_9EURO|nr:hypothetical protein N7463_005199 [Penicillium fimorum]